MLIYFWVHFWQNLESVIYFIWIFLFFYLLSTTCIYSFVHHIDFEISWRISVFLLTSSRHASAEPAARRTGFVCVWQKEPSAVECTDSPHGPGSKLKTGVKSNGPPLTGREMDNSKRTVVVTGLSSFSSYCCRFLSADSTAAWSGGKVVGMTAARTLMASGCYCLTPPQLNTAGGSVLLVVVVITTACKRYEVIF